MDCFLYISSCENITNVCGFKNKQKFVIVDVDANKFWSIEIALKG